MAPAPARNISPSSVKNTAPASSNGDEEALPPFKYDAAKNTAYASAKKNAPFPAKNTSSASAKNKAPVPAKNTVSASTKNKAPSPAKNKGSASPKNEVVVPAASDADEVPAPPQDTTLRRFINFLCENSDFSTPS
jgi:hypothetical protein